MSVVSELTLLIRQHQHDDVQQLALQRNRFSHMSDADFRFFLQQIDGRQRTAHKLPSLAQLPLWWYPVRLSCEQCSSEATARYKAQLMGHDTNLLIDLTAGYGVDCYFMAEHAAQAHYVERNAELCAIASHNFSLYRSHIQVHNTTAEDFLTRSTGAAVLQDSVRTTGAAALQGSARSTGEAVLIYLDPARRSQSGGKVFRIEDCEPNVLDLMPTLRASADRIMIKFSPMLDVTAALRAMGSDWDTHIVAVNNEVKEVLFYTGSGVIHAVNICPTHTDTIRFSEAEERNAIVRMAGSIGAYLYEPNAAIIKAGAYRWISQQYGLDKLDANTHLYTSDVCLSDFPGRVWKVLEVLTKHSTLDAQLKYSILSRNYPMTPDQLRKKFKLKDGDERYIIAARHQGKPTLLLASRSIP